MSVRTFFPDGSFGVDSRISDRDVSDQVSQTDNFHVDASCPDAISLGATDTQVLQIHVVLPATSLATTMVGKKLWPSLMI